MNLVGISLLWVNRPKAKLTWYLREQYPTAEVPEPPVAVPPVIDAPVELDPLGTLPIPYPTAKVKVLVPVVVVFILESIP